MNCLLNALAMSFGLMCVLSLKVIELEPEVILLFST